jgi:hypothetical protein
MCRRTVENILWTFSYKIRGWRIFCAFLCFIYTWNSQLKNMKPNKCIKLSSGLCSNYSGTYGFNGLTKLPFHFTLKLSHEPLKEKERNFIKITLNVSLQLRFLCPTFTLYTRCKTESQRSPRVTWMYLFPRRNIHFCFEKFHHPWHWETTTVRNGFYFSFHHSLSGESGNEYH